MTTPIEAPPATRYQIGEWVYAYIGRMPRPFYAEIVKIDFEDKRFLFWKWQDPIYWIKVPNQEWMVGSSENDIARTQSELNSR